jgi:ABC-type cobalamin/Fe3+-siderophores transport system ATPase subunit
MLDVELNLRNYRCFGDEPARIRIGDGFTALTGVNNSGKSSLLRALYEIRQLFGVLQYNEEQIAKDATVKKFYGGDPLGFWQPNLISGERLFRAGADKPAFIELTVYDSVDGPFLSREAEQLVVQITYDRGGVSTIALRTEKGVKFDGALATDGLNLKPLVSAMAELSQTMYIGPFRNAIHVGGQGNYYDITTGQEFVKTFAQFKSGPDPASNEAVAELIDELRRIFGFERLDINPTPEKDALQLTVDGRSYRLAEQGAGLAHFIVVLVNVFVRKPSLLLIDEPELNLHASLQLDFLTTLSRYTKHGVVFATHSLGLARTAADRIYTVTKPSGGTSHVRAYDADRELVTLLGQLSFDRRPELGFSKVLLVEGTTEVRAIMQLLRLYGKEHDVVLLPLHGDALIQPKAEHELMELLRIGGDVHYLIDSERAAPNKPLSSNRQGFVDLCKRLNISGHVLARRALENYFTDDAVRRVFGESVTALKAYEKKGSRQGWPKTQNWRIATEMRREDLDATDLGVFLESL